MDPNTAKKQLSKNVFSLAVVQIATYILPLLSVPIVSRIIGPEKFGIINFGVAFISYFTLIISYSFDFSATRKISKDPENSANRNRVFSEVFFTQCVLFLISTIIFIILLFVVPELQEHRIVIAFSYLICISTLFTQNWLFQAMQDLSKVALFNLISKILFTMTIIVVIKENEDYIWQPFLIGVIQIFVSLISFCWAIKKYEIKFIKTSLLRCFKILWEEKSIFISLVFVNLYSYTSIVILGLYRDAEQVGYYTSAQRLIYIAQSVLTMPIAQAFYPFIGKAFGESRERGLEVVQKLVPIVVIILGTAFIGMLLLGPIAIRIFYGNKFEAAILVFQILSITPLIFALNNILGVQLMLNLRLDKEFLKISVCAAVLSLVLNILLIKRLGYLGTTLNSLLIEVFLLISMYINLRNKGLNPLNLKYFKFNFFAQYAKSMVKRFFPRAI